MVDSKWRNGNDVEEKRPLSKGYKLDVVTGPSNSNDPDSDADDSFGSWQGHPRWYGQGLGTKHNLRELWANQLHLLQYSIKEKAVKKEMAVAYFTILSRQSLGETDENHLQLQLLWSVSQAGFENETFEYKTELLRSKCAWQYLRKSTKIWW